jgi:carbon-monoxide dehydrogenase small subunit
VGDSVSGSRALHADGVTGAVNGARGPTTAAWWPRVVNLKPSGYGELATKEGHAMQRVAISVMVNGQRVATEVPARKLLTDFLKEDVGLTGVRVGCEHGVCGACTILVDGQTVRGCLMLAAQADGADVQTVESLAVEGRLHPIQQAFWDHHGLQCGYCTPGMLITAYEFLQKNPRPTESDVREAIAGNICRCTGYVNIVRSILAAAARREGEIAR